MAGLNANKRGMGWLGGCIALIGSSEWVVGGGSGWQWVLGGGGGWQLLSATRGNFPVKAERPNGTQKCNFRRRIGVKGEQITNAKRKCQWKNVFLLRIVGVCGHGLSRLKANFLGYIFRLEQLHLIFCGFWLYWVCRIVLKFRSCFLFYISQFGFPRRGV